MFRKNYYQQVSLELLKMLDSILMFFYRIITHNIYLHTVVKKGGQTRVMIFLILF